MKKIAFLLLILIFLAACTADNPLFNRQQTDAPDAPQTAQDTPEAPADTPALPEIPTDTNHATTADDDEHTDDDEYADNGEYGEDDENGDDEDYAEYEDDEDYTDDADDAPAISRFPGLAPSGRYPANDAVAVLLAGHDYGRIVFYHVPSAIYTTPAFENGFGEAFMFVHGVVQSLEVVDGADAAIIQTAEGSVALTFPANLFEIAVAIGRMQPPTYIDMLQVGSAFGFYFQYFGLSAAVHMPHGALVAIE